MPTLLSALLLTLLPSTSAFAAWQDEIDGTPTSRGYPAVVPFAPESLHDCIYNDYVPDPNSPYIVRYYDIPADTWTYQQNPWGYMGEYPTCDTHLRPAGPPGVNSSWIADGPAKQISQTIDNCKNSQSATITQGYMTTVTNTATDQYGVHVGLSGGNDEDTFGKKIKGVIEASFNYSHTVTVGSATATYTNYTLGVAPYKKGYLEFVPKMAHAYTETTATYFRPTHGKKVWKTTVYDKAPVLIPNTTTADGSWRIHYVPC
ncbi:hypothetical protein AB0D37_43665 [Streptomyces sp. NPDC048384]|uniref:hypothetical protein n=1 Tax=Streptomyces sp. NPDC048384 TaxID=3155487 RepID=UPI00343ED9D0